ncbi:type VII secretion protein EssC [Paenibacillus sp. MMS20-IR301]|uniref:type VII secretion protein EssC n=1 Tax=Paenibacillus sp. MMS20-IR301 TaxID=2895946 RepID=UPI0028E464C1|nr:type VII secretion protein EssC [Paenibacillus sp. MMS20-IR301]WNS41082.1 type VII secretion protein EssC [Paenibacillus sp. MMS20-IR301]
MTKMSLQEMLANQVQRTPRIKPNYPEGELALEDPARPSDKPTFSWLTLIVPPIGMMLIAIFMSTLTRSYTILISTMSMTFLTVMVSVMNYKSSVKKHLEQNKKLEKKYLNYLFQVRNELQNAASTQREAYTYIHPDIPGCIEIVRARSKQLWERTAIEDDFLNTRIGVGIQPISLVPTYSSRAKAIDDVNPLEEIAAKICEEMYFVRDIPVYLPLKNINTLGIFGSKREVRDCLNAAIVHLTTHQGYDDVRIVCVMQPEELEHWEWLKWLPHTWDKDRRMRSLATTAYEASNLADELLPVLRKREEGAQNGYGMQTLQTPHYVFLVFAPELWDSTEMMKVLLSNNSELGATSIFISEKIDVALPLNCQAILEIRDGKGMVRKDTKQLLNHLADHFSADSLDKQHSEFFARSLSPLRIKEGQNNSYIPSMVTFLESFEVEQVEELNVLQRWTNHQANRTLSTPLGLGAGAKSLVFDMHEKSYGPHGLVAGTTGSGKSELLQSLLLGLAVNYHPHEAAFVLIDYKGGGMANAFLGLPHLVGTITNLGGNQINRALASIKSELLRRQRLFSDAGVTSIDQYIVLYRSREVSLPLPHLIIVVDEFAELKSDQPEFMKELVSAARVGRSLGIHLILATQKPSGVVDDQIWSNSRFKLCLKVQTPSDSQEMLKRPEAAEIKEKGRGYLQVGNNEVFTLFQSSWSGAPYAAGNSAGEGRPVMDIVTLGGERRSLLPKVTSSGGTLQLSELQAVVKHIADLSAEQSIREAFQLWLPPLPETLLLTEVLEPQRIWNGAHWQQPADHLTATVGRVDNPADQEQYNLDINFNLNGHLLVYGAPSSGKTMLLKTIIMSLALKYEPEYVHFYILDFGTRTLGVFHDLPHLGDVIYPEDEQKLGKLLSWLLSQLDERKRKFSQLGISNLVSYCAATGEKVPYIVILLDNYTGFAEAYDDHVLDLAKLVREGGNYGIYFVFAANAVSSYPYRISQNIKQALVFQMSDRLDYTSILGRTEGMEPTNTVGRGLLKDKRIVEFHTALPGEGSTDDQVAASLRRISSEMKAVAGDINPAGIAVIPEKLSLPELLEHASRAHPEGREYLVPVGLDWTTTLPAEINVKQVSNFVVSYTGQQQADFRFNSIVQALRASAGQVIKEFYLLDSGGAGLSGLKANPGLTRYMDTAGAFLELTQSLIEQLQLRKNDARQAIAASPEPGAFDEAGYILSKYPLLVILMPHFKSAFDLMENESLDHLERIARFGGRLGVLLMAGSSPAEWNKMQFTTELAGELINSGNALLSGGAPGDHTSYAALLEHLEYHELNEAMGSSKAMLITEGVSRRLKLITEL